MLTLTDSADRTYTMVFGRKIRLMKNGRSRRITNITLAKWVNGVLVWYDVDMAEPELETALRSNIRFSSFVMPFPPDLNRYAIQFHVHNHTTDISMLGHDQVYRLNFTFVMEN
jgi:hypothetical protein